jgi:glycosyltransferase involved in cell wall biosynthesis
MNKKIKILRITHTLDPSHGGIATALVDNSISLLSYGINVDILTYDPHGSIFNKTKKIKIINKGPAYGGYGFSLKLLMWLYRNKDKYDHFIIEGIWQFSTLLARLFLKKKYSVRIHGQLDPFFSKNFHKKIKKQIYWMLVEKSNLMNSNSILLTSKIEKNLINKTYVNTNGIKKSIINDGILKPKINKNKMRKIFFKTFPTLINQKFLVFIGRFDKKKGLDTLLKAIVRLKKKKIQYKFFIAGKNNSYTKYLKKFSNENKIDEYIVWSDKLSNDLKWGAICASQGTVLASNGENFGVAVVESLACSKPVLTTTKVNIYKEIISNKAGFISTNNPTSFEKILSKFINIKKKDLLTLNKSSYKCFNKCFNIAKKNTLSDYLKKQP